MSLVRALAPRHWTRWVVFVDDQRVGSVEKRGMGSGWYAHDRDGRLLGAASSTRALAVEAVSATVSRVPEGTYDPSACETCGSLKRDAEGDLLHYEEDCFK